MNFESASVSHVVELDSWVLAGPVSAGSLAVRPKCANLSRMVGGSWPVVASFPASYLKRL